MGPEDHAGALHAASLRVKRYPWVLEAIEDREVAEVRASLERIIAPAETKAASCAQRRQACFSAPPPPGIDPLIEAP
jgi:hypothetical protein